MGSDALDVSVSVQAALQLRDGELHAQLLGQSPRGFDDGATGCCVSFANGVDVATILESIDMSQGAPLERV